MMHHLSRTIQFILDTRSPRSKVEDEGNSSGADSGVYEDEDASAPTPDVPQPAPVTYRHSNDQQRRRPSQPQDERMEIEDDDDSGDDVEYELGATGGAPKCAHLFYAQQISVAEFEEEGRALTKDAVAELMQTEQYQKMINTCSICQACWLYQQVTPNCRECGGYAIQRPCPVCDGRCLQTWTRDAKMTHSFQKAHWNGKCALPPDQQMVLLFQKCVESDEETIVNGMEDLHTS